MILSDVCLSVAYFGPKSRTERPRKTKFGIEVAHVPCDSDTIFVKRSKVKVTRERGHTVEAFRTACYSRFFIPFTSFATQQRQSTRSIDIQLILIIKKVERDSEKQIEREKESP